MPTRGQVQYHEPGRTNARILIDADGIPGNRTDPEYTWVEVQLEDLRERSVSPAMATDGLCLVEAPSCVRVPEDLARARDEYERELIAIVEGALPSTEVVVFDHTLRAEDHGHRPPSYHAHCDYSAWSARKRMQELLGPDRAARWQTGDFAVINLWRPLVRPVHSAPLGLVDPRSLDPKDWVTVDIVFPDRRGQVLGLAHSPAHRWCFVDRMRPEEAVLFTVYSTTGVQAVPHAAVRLLDAPADARPRQSIESRMLVRLA